MTPTEREGLKKLRGQITELVRRYPSTVDFECEVMMQTLDAVLSISPLPVVQQEEECKGDCVLRGSHCRPDCRGQIPAPAEQEQPQRHPCEVCGSMRPVTGSGLITRHKVRGEHGLGYCAGSWRRVSTSLATPVDQEQPDLRTWVQHKKGCKTLNNGHRWEPSFKRAQNRWWGAWVPDASKVYDCTCGLADALQAREGKR